MEAVRGMVWIFSGIAQCGILPLSLARPNRVRRVRAPYLNSLHVVVCDPVKQYRCWDVAVVSFSFFAFNHTSIETACRQQISELFDSTCCLGG